MHGIHRLDAFGSTEVYVTLASIWYDRRLDQRLDTTASSRQAVWKAHKFRRGVRNAFLIKSQELDLVYTSLFVARDLDNRLDTDDAYQVRSKLAVQIRS